MCGIVAALLAACFALAPMHDTWREAFVVGLPTAAIVLWLTRTRPAEAVTRCALGAALMILSALQIDQTHLVEAHFGVIVALALLLIYRDWVPIVFAAALIAIHHVAFYFMQHRGEPVWILPSEEGFGTVLVHASYVILETTLLSILALRLRDEIEAVGCDPGELARVSHELARGNVAVEVDSGGASAGSLACAMAAMRDELHRAVRGAGEVLEAIAAGDLSRRVEIEASGEFRRLADHVNRTVEFLSSFNRAQHEVVQHANAGDFSVRCETIAMMGYQLEMATGLNRLVSSVESFVNEFGEVQSALAHCDLTKPISLAYQGRLEELRRDTNRTLKQLALMVERIRGSADTIAAASAEIAQASADLSTRTEQQREAITNTARAIAHLSNAVHTSAAHTATASELAQAADRAAVAGGKAVTLVVSTMEGIDVSSNKMADIIGVIQEIAFQTNLLALNAAVEAARAGEQGLAFAVVAGEVRALASRSAIAAKEIKTLIGGNMERIERGVKLVTHAGESMLGIVHSVERVTKVVSEIAAASHQQSADIEGVNQAISQIETVTQQNASMVEQAATAAQSMASEARKLRESVSLFKLTQPAQAQNNEMPGIPVALAR
jgi:methyl-accepting chemotaxis protein